MQNRIWHQNFTLEGLNGILQNTLSSHLAMEFVRFDDTSLTARMPVDARTKQPVGLLHGGATAALAETLGSIASVLVLENFETHTVVGLELNCSHLRSRKAGWVFGTVHPVKIGRQVHVWEIDVRGEDEQMVSRCRLTTMVVPRKNGSKDS